MKDIIGFFLSLGVIVAAVCWKGYVLATLWAWFAVPLFALPVLSVAYAIGISTLIGCFTQHPTKTGEESKHPALDGFVNLFVAPTLSLFIGWIVKHWL